MTNPKKIRIGIETERKKKLTKKNKLRTSSPKILELNSRENRIKIKGYVRLALTM